MNECTTRSPAGDALPPTSEPYRPATAPATLTEAQRPAWLAAFTIALAATDRQTFRACLTQWLLPTVADMYCLAVVEPDDAIETYAAAHDNADLNRLQNELKAYQLYDQQRPSGVFDVIRSRQLRVYTTLEPSDGANPVQDDQQAAFFAALHIHTAVIVPLLVQGRAIGALIIGMMRVERQLRLHDSDFLDEIAQRIGLILDNQRLQQQAQEAVESRDATLAIVAHELRTPLTAMIAQLQLLQRRVDEAGINDDRILHGLKTLEHQTRRLNVLVDTLQEATSVEQQPRPLANERFALRPIVQRVADAFVGAPPHHRLVTELSVEPLSMIGDPLRIEQALQNLLQNAVKYSPYGGTITVRLERNGDHARITVSDEGIGIPLEARTRIFDRFYRAANAVSQGINGVGVGLYIVHAIIALHNGTIRLAEMPGAGASFVIELPLDAAAERPPQHQAS